jgi:2'-5' RNA ligase
MNKTIENLVKSGDFLKFKILVSKHITNHEKIFDLYNQFRNKLDLEPVSIINDSMDEEKFGCLMLQFSIPNWDSILDNIDEDDIFDNEENEYGLEYEPHVTILYGFHDDTDIDKLKSMIPDKEFSVELTGVSAFKSKECDILKFDVKSTELFELNKICINNFNYTNEFPDYNPHMTITYLKSGLAEKYIKKLKLKKSITLKSDNIVYSKKDFKKKRLHEREIKFMDGAESVEVKDECKLGGLPDGTSKQCNQGDISVLTLKKL